MRRRTQKLGIDFALSVDLLDQAIAAYITGDDESGNPICRRLDPVIRAEVARFLPVSDPDRDDVVQEILLAFLAYLRRAARSPASAEAFVVTMAGNRCRNLYRWRKRRPSLELSRTADRLVAGNLDPLELLESREREAMLRDAFARLEAPCRNLLRAIYSEQRPIEELQGEAGLSTVQGIYYRKYVCLRKLSALLNRNWSGGRYSGAGEMIVHHHSRAGIRSHE